MANLFYSELLKNKRSRTMYILIGLTVIYIGLMFGYAYYNNDVYSDFVRVYKFMLSYIIFLILPMIILSLSTSIFANDYRQGVLRNIFTIPVNRTKYFVCKLIYILVNIIGFMLIIFIITCLVSWLTRFSSTMTMSLILRFLYLCLISGIMMFLAVIPVSLLVILTKGNSLITNLFGMLYIIGSLFLLKILESISPMVSAIHMIWYKNNEGVQTHDNIVLYLFNIMIVVIVYTVLSVKIIKQQEL